MGKSPEEKVWVIKTSDSILEMPVLVEKSKSSFKLNNKNGYFTEKGSAVYGMIINLKKKIAALDDIQIQMFDELERRREEHQSIERDT